MSCMLAVTASGMSDGLREEHRVLKLWICWSGSSGFGDDFAIKFAWYYKRCDVYGYTEAIWGATVPVFEENQKHKTAASGARASEVRIKLSA